MSDPTIIDRANILLLSLIQSGIQIMGRGSLEELARDCVRTCRAIEAEVDTPTERKEARPKPQRPAPPQPEEEIPDEEALSWDR